MEVVAQSMGFKTHIRSYMMRVEGISADKTSYFSVTLEVFEVAPTFLMVDIQKTTGDGSKYLKAHHSCAAMTILHDLHPGCRGRVEKDNLGFCPTVHDSSFV